jgi:hypothetical protein
MFIWNRIKLEKEIAHLITQRDGIQKSWNELKAMQQKDLIKMFGLTLVLPFAVWGDGGYTTRHYAMHIQSNAIAILDENIQAIELQLSK